MAVGALDKIKKAKNFLHRDIWLINISAFGKVKSLLISALKVALITVSDFIHDKCVLRASSLTYYFFLAVVPFLAVATAAIKGFGLQDEYGETLLNRILMNPEFSREIINYIENTNLETLGLFGAIALVYIAILLLSNIEKSFNDMWGVREQRPYLRKIVYYLFAIMVVPVFMTIIVSNVTVVMTGDMLSSGIWHYVVVWLALTLLYIAFTNEKVKFHTALSGGLLGSILWNLAWLGFIFYAVKVKQFDRVYGSFSHIFLTFVWVYVSWLIILLGSEFAFALQNFKTYRKEGKSDNISFSYKQKLALIILHLIYDRFKKGESPMSADDIINTTRGPIKMINDLLYELMDMGILVENKKDNKRYYSPAKSEEKVTVPYILYKLKRYGISDIPMNRDPRFARVEQILKRIRKESEENYKSIKVSEI